MPSISLAELFVELDRCDQSVPIDLLVDRMRQLDLSSAALDASVRFADDGYCRNLVHLGPGYAALLLCWRSGQSSPIHDHRGSACGLRVLRGTATEVRYERGSDGGLVETGTNVYPEGSVCGTYDSDIHTLVNRRPAGEDLITLHVYTPPMRSFNAYTTGGAVQHCHDREVLAEERRRAQAGVAEITNPRSPAGNEPRRRDDPARRPPREFA